MRLASSLSCTALLSVSLTPSQSIAAEQPEPGQDVLTMRVDGEVEVGAEGRVISHTLRTRVTDEIGALVARKVADWSFHPPTKDGVPVIARGKMRITLTALEHGKDYAVSIDKVTFLADPKEQASRGRWGLVGTGAKRHRFQASGAITMELRLAPDGSILETYPTQCSVFAVRPGQSMESACRAFQAYGEQLVSKAKGEYRPAPGEPPRTGPSTGTLPIFFTYGPYHRTDNTAPGKWRIEWRTPYKPAPWNDKNASRIGASDVTDMDGFTAEEDGLRLRTDAAVGASG